MTSEDITMATKGIHQPREYIETWCLMKSLVIDMYTRLSLKRQVAFVSAEQDPLEF